MPKLHVDILELSDNSYNIGLDLGKHFKDKPLISVIDFATKSEINMNELETIILPHAPHLIDELHGIADGIVPIQMRLFNY